MLPGWQLIWLCGHDEPGVDTFQGVIHIGLGHIGDFVQEVAIMGFHGQVDPHDPVLGIIAGRFPCLNGVNGNIIVIGYPGHTGGSIPGDL